MHRISFTHTPSYPNRLHPKANKIVVTGREDQSSTSTMTNNNDCSLFGRTIYVFINIITHSYTSIDTAHPSVSNI